MRRSNFIKAQVSEFQQNFHLQRAEEFWALGEAIATFPEEVY